MPVFRWKGGDIFGKLKAWVRNKYKGFQLTYRTIFYNEFMSCGMFFETLLEPMIWCIDKFVRYLGPSFVVLIVWLTLSVMVVFYVCLVPHSWEESIPWTCCHLVVGHYFLYCTVFYYFRAAFTDPGHPPEEIPETVSICKKCIAPKPPRAHHCSVCNKCVLKMDHHCPWLNNCIGYNNHRYFILFCTYMWIGTTYASYAAYPLFKQHFYGVTESSPAGIFYPFYMMKRAYDDYQARKHGDHAIAKSHIAVIPTSPLNPEPGDLMEDENGQQMRFHTFVVYEFLLCSAVSVALLFLLAWHCRLVSRGETSIEYHINHKQRIRLRKKGLKFKNPYHFGIVDNLEMLLGIDNKRGWPYLWYLFMPTANPPEGNGLQFKTCNYKVDDGPFIL